MTKIIETITKDIEKLNSVYLLSPERLNFLGIFFRSRRIHVRHK